MPEEKSEPDARRPIRMPAVSEEGGVVADERVFGLEPGAR
jgi:hypothetical protein